MKKIIMFILVVMAVFIIKTLYQAGVFKTLVPHSELTDIKVYENAAGTEDIAVNRAKGFMFISSSDRRALIAGENPDDGIFMLDLNADPNIQPKKIPTNFKGEFHPHGISLLSKMNTDYLFVINHNKQGDIIELFEFKDQMLNHLRSFKGNLMCCPNDLVAVDVDKFYVTNDHGNKKGFMRFVEDYLKIAESSVLYFDGEAFTTAYDNLNYANGINVSSDGAKIYVAETTGKKITVLNRNTITGELDWVFEKHIDSGLDNITIDGEGNLWIASHPKLLKFVAHAADAKKISPSQVLKLTPNGENDFNVEEIYLNEGEQISASSTALYYQGELFIGVVFENQLLRGSIKNP